jgi:hypothetical protein
MEFSEKDKSYKPLNPNRNHKTDAETQWYPTLKPSAKQSLELSLGQKLVLNENDSLILAVGIEFGKPGDNGSMEPIKYSGSAKILTTF